MNSTISGIYIIYILIPVLLFIACYHDVLSWMYGRCSSVDSYYSHAFLIPFISGFLIWKKRQRLKSMTPEMSLWGLIIISFAVLLHISGIILYVFSISGFSIFLLVIGSSLFLFGGKITSEMKFPLAFLVFTL